MKQEPIDPPEQRRIWIPQFAYKGDYTESEEVLKDFGAGGTGDDIDSKSYLKTVRFLNPKNIQIIIKAQLEIQTKIFEERVKLTPKDTDTIINNDFLIGIVSNDLLQLMKIPLISVLVKKKEFLTV